jgi:hypothetical protein
MLQSHHASSDITATATASSSSCGGTGCCWVNVVYDQLTQSNRDEERQKQATSGTELNTWKQFQIFGLNDRNPNPNTGGCVVVDRLHVERLYPSRLFSHTGKKNGRQSFITKVP